MNWLEILLWVLVVIIVAAVADLIRLAILREIWKRRHARMVKEIQQRAAEQMIVHGLDHK
jgi:NADH:ubiquinone oxidoreductase subunit K